MASLVNHSVTNLINGVSEQAPSVRLDNQLEEQVNCFSDVTRGLTKRNGLELKQITQLDIEDTFKIAFTVDGVKHMIALNANSATPLQYVPLSTDVDALAVAIEESQYFKEMSRGDLQIIEDKEKVYLLNRRQIVGGASSRATYFDIKLIRQDNFTTPTTWDAGGYTITIGGVADPDYVPLAVAGGQVVVTVDRDKTLQQIADDINADVDLIAETGICTISGTISNYRISFNEIPSGFIAPTTLTNENTAITEGQDNIIYSAWSGAIGDIADTARINLLGDGSTQYRWNNITIGDTFANTIVSGIYTYYKGAEIGSANNDTWYKIRRSYVEYVQLQYEIEVTTPSVVGESDSEFSTKAMIWVTGVSSNQTYNTTITYYAISNPQILLTATSSTSVGTTASHIKLNWVANDIRDDYNGSPNLSAVVYDNAVRVVTDSGFAIAKVEVTNNYDITSISGVAEAVESNQEGIQSIDSLPPSFADDFKVRVNTSKDNKSNFYMVYSSDFKGWKEGGLDESRFLDFTTMPYIIDKEKIKETGIITIEPASWKQALAGDIESNKDPSFVGRTINDIFFYGSRLGFATDDTLVMSSINEHDTFFRTTTSQTVKSDRVDIKLDSSKIGYDPIKHVITYEGKLFLNTGSNQSILLVNTSFDLTTARLSEVSSYSLGDNKPMPVGNGLYFANTANGVTNVFNYTPTGNNNYTAIEATKHCPRYLQGQFKSMAYSSDVTIVSTFKDKKTLYVQNRYTQGGQMLQNAWHKWTLPFNVEHFYFEDNVLFVIMSAFDDGEVNKYTIVTQYDLRPQDVELIEDEIYIGWRPMLDCWTKDKTLIENFGEFVGVNDKSGVSYETVQEAYDSDQHTQANLTTIIETPVTFKNHVNATSTGNTITSTAGGWGNSGAATNEDVTEGSAYFEYPITSETDIYMIGFSEGDTSPSHTDIDFAIYQAGININAWHSGSEVQAQITQVQLGDVLKMDIAEDKTVTVYKNDVLVYTYLNDITYPALVDVAFNTAGTSIEDIVIRKLANYDGTNGDGPHLDKVGSPVYYWKVDGNLNTIIFNDGTPINFGNNTLTFFDDGGYRYFKGDTDDGTGHFEVTRVMMAASNYSLNEIIYGVNYKANLELSQIVPRQQSESGFSTFNYATLMLRRMRLLLSNSGLFNVTVDFKDRTDYVTKYTGLPLGEFVVGRGTVSDINFNFPINGKADRVSISIETQDSTPFNLLATEWQGQLINKGRQI